MLLIHILFLWYKCIALYVTVSVNYIIVHSVFLQNWSKLNKSGGGPWPEERTGPVACCLNYGQQFPQLLVTGGVDRQLRPLADVWILNIHRGKWKKVKRHMFICSLVPRPFPVGEKWPGKVGATVDPCT